MWAGPFPARSSHADSKPAEICAVPHVASSWGRLGLERVGWEDGYFFGGNYYSDLSPASRNTRQTRSAPRLRAVSSTCVSQ